MARQSQAPVRLRKQTNPVSFPRTVRPDARAMNTSARAGRVYPAAFIPIMPEDSVRSSRVSFLVRMEETEKMLANAVHFRAHAWFVSYAALERFDGLDSVAYAWAQREGAEPIVQKYEYNKTAHDPFYSTFGEHIKEDEMVNDLYIEAYNQVINYRRKQVSKSLPMRDENDHTLARALWGQTAIARIVPDFDAALIQAEFPLNLVGSTITGPDLFASAGVAASTTSVREIDPDGTNGEIVTSGSRFFAPLSAERVGAATTNEFVAPIVWELQEQGITASIANIELAKKTQAFALLRQQFAGNDEELIDLLMRGLRFPSNAFIDPILLSSGSGVFGMAQRYATDADNLETYVVNGQTRVDLSCRLPVQPTGGVIVVTYEIVPEPVFDRQGDLFLRDDFDDLPNALRDHLDTQPVQVVPNLFVDALHTAPAGTFGYAPMNFSWARRRVGVGGRFLRTLASDPSAEDQQHIWSVRSVDPVLNDDAFLVPEDLAHNVFRDTVLDPFLIQCVHEFSIEGITQFGPSLYESSGDYDAVASIVPDDVIDPDS